MGWIVAAFPPSVNFSCALPEVVRDILAAAPCLDATRYVFKAGLLPACQKILLRPPLTSAFAVSGVRTPDCAFASDLA